MMTDDGDCGSWVIDDVRGDLYGQIISGYPAAQTAYIIPAVHIFKEILSLVGQPRLPGTKSSATLEAQNSSRGRFVNTASSKTLPRMSAGLAPQSLDPWSLSDELLWGKEPTLLQQQQMLVPSFQKFVDDLAGTPASFKDQVDKLISIINTCSKLCGKTIKRCTEEEMSSALLGLQTTMATSAEEMSMELEGVSFRLEDGNYISDVEFQRSLDSLIETIRRDLQTQLVARHNNLANKSKLRSYGATDSVLFETWARIEESILETFHNLTKRIAARGANYTPPPVKVYIRELASKESLRALESMAGQYSIKDWKFSMQGDSVCAIEFKDLLTATKAVNLLSAYQGPGVNGALSDFLGSHQFTRDGWEIGSSVKPGQPTWKTYSAWYNMREVIVESEPNIPASIESTCREDITSQKTTSATHLHTYYGQVRTPADAIKLFEACRLGLLPRLKRRLSEAERQLIKSGSIFVWDESEAGIRRLADGKSWEASRTIGGFLTYRELQGKKIEQGSATGKGSDTGGNIHNTKREGQCYEVKPDGLIKQHFSITTSTGQHLHLISYRSLDGIDSSELLQPATDPSLRDITPSTDMYPQSTTTLGPGPSIIEKLNQSFPSIRKSRRIAMWSISDKGDDKNVGSPVHNTVEAQAHLHAESIVPREVENSEVYELPAVEPVGFELNDPMKMRMQEEQELPVSPLPLSPLPMLFSMSEMRGGRPSPPTYDSESAGKDPDKKSAAEHTTYYNP